METLKDLTEQNPQIVGKLAQINADIELAKNKIIEAANNIDGINMIIQWDDDEDLFNKMEVIDFCASTKIIELYCDIIKTLRKEAEQIGKTYKLNHGN